MRVTITYHDSLTGTPEAGGWTTHEVKRILRGLAGLNFVYVLQLMNQRSRE